MKKLFEKYREIIIYLVVGVLTTIVSWAVVFAGKLFLDMEVSWQNFVNNTLSWVAGVLFAYPLNRRWVFHSKNPKIMKEFLGFASSRLSTWVLDVIVMWLFVNVWTLKTPIRVICDWCSYTPGPEELATINYWVVKIFISSVLVMIANYVLSKFFVFRKKKESSLSE